MTTPDPNPEGLFALIRGRRSVRRFRDEPVDRATLDRLIELAGWAPSAGNRQGWAFTVVTSVEARRRMAEAVRRRWESVLAESGGRGTVSELAGYVARHSDVSGAPALILVSARRVDALQRRLFGDAAAVASGGIASAAMAAQTLMLAAHALGLGSCCMTGPLIAGDELGRIAGLGPREEIVCLVALGRPAEIPAAPARKSAAEIARFIE